MRDLDTALQAARAGADIVRAGFDADRSVAYKARSNPVTATDAAAEAAIVAVISRHRPADAILAEEGGGSGEASGRRWVIDPLDGTVNFVHRIPQIAVSVALWEGDTPLVGVVIDPLRNEEFTAEAGGDARLNGVPIAASNVTDLAVAVAATGFPYDHHEHAAAYAANLGDVLAHVNGIRRFGSAALDLAWVAAGRFDAYWELTVAPWDQAAGILLVESAGGRVTDLAGRRSTPRHGPVVATNGKLHDSFLPIATATLPPHVTDRPMSR